MTYKARLRELEVLLNIFEEDDNENGHTVDLTKLKKLIFHGLPEDKHRPLVWRLLLNYLPQDKKKWEEVLTKKRNLYSNFVDDLLLQESGNNPEQVVEDHPLNPNPDSKWQTFFKDNDVLLQIDKDVRRLCPEMSFFQSATQYPNKYIVEQKMDRLHCRVQYNTLEYGNVERRGLGITKITTKPGVSSNMSSSANSDCDDGICEGVQQTEAHWEVVERILFIYAKLNPGQGYVQGMNEIIGPIYYSLATDSDLNWRAHAESDTFFLFTNLMGEIRDFFIRTLDNTTSGIKQMMNNLMDRLKSRDKAVYEKLQFQEIYPQYYSFRWITLLLSQEFPLPEVLRIWDSLLGDENRFDFLIDVCCAMIIHVRTDLLQGDFPTNMKLLQNFPVIDVRDILTVAINFKSRVS